ncbi:PREDICTED: uncharacterized protein LOC108577709 [Habropoda laboriosa]|uniref:uncharacterized protein LOC108577709 n=1 Tax=Habropoda laboriosa TaxID=597456 RepID=UPI00083CA76E|nr:PREDICTED: uncharacterized protein LOC108577709 [Habropoda laboriosa]
MGLPKGCRNIYERLLYTGADSFQAALELKKQCIALARAGGFHLRQWTSNDARLIADLQIRNQQGSLCLDPSQTKKTLGVYWNPTNDQISYIFKQLSPEQSRITKRKSAIGWDEPVPQTIKQSWLEIKNELHLLDNFTVPRRTAIQNTTQLELHGFSDASESAYGACIYIKSTNERGQHAVNLLCAKSRVAPLKIISLPRLELCAARLLAKLYKEVKKAFYQTEFKRIRFWSNSTITLHWIRTPPHLLKTFVANRVNEIQTEVHFDNWFHIATADNPADFVSRGQLPSQFIKNAIWKFGPHWLALDEARWLISTLETIEIVEKRRPITLVTLPNVDLLEKYSSIDYLNRIIAYILRFYNNVKHDSKKGTDSLSLSEIQNAHFQIIKLVQLETFPSEINDLKTGRNVNRKSKLINLNPFIDENGIIRVGSRLKHAVLRYDQKYPIVLPHKHHVTELIIRQVHLRQFHSGTQATLYTVRQKYWPIAGKSIVKQVLHKCISCCKYNPKTPQYIMGNLPKNRIIQTRPFEAVGIDYCGPFLIKEKKFRNKTKLKCYVVVFVCFATKAIHLELATDLTTESCLGALKRFVARRGKPRHVYSDNGTNFVGAKNEIIQIRALLLSDEYKNRLRQFLTQENIEWHFSPPRSPHFGGLWETVVRSFKKHLHKTIGAAMFTYEQFYTLIVEIEAILNSRPLIPISSDPNDFLALSPNHFLIGESLASLPEHNFVDTRTNKLSLWQHIQEIKQHFWRRWQTEYLQELHTRSKWHTGDGTNIKEGTLVTIRDDNCPPLQWQLGRVVALHPGEDDVVRVATIQTPHGTYKRALKNPAEIKTIIKVEEENSLATFIRNLTQPLRTIIWQSRPKTLKEAQDLAYEAQREEELANRLVSRTYRAEPPKPVIKRGPCEPPKEFRPPHGKPICFKCNREGHYARNCRQNFPNRRQIKGPDIRYMQSDEIRTAGDKLEYSSERETTTNHDSPIEDSSSTPEQEST